MSPGALARKLLGPSFRPVGEAYRRIFVDMPKVVDALSSHIPVGSQVLDVGGGDGYVANLLLTRRPDIRVTMTDLAERIGGFIDSANHARVTLLPRTDISAVSGTFDIVTLADVVHHIPVAIRENFFDAVSDTALRTGCQSILVKDIQPGKFRSILSLLADHYITGDKGVSLVSFEELRFHGFVKTEIMMPDSPNYCAIFTRIQ